MSKPLTIAVQKNGRLSEKSLQLFKSCGIQLPNGDRKLKTTSSNFPLELLFLRDDDIPQYVEQGIADAGMLGANEVWEKNKDVSVVRKLGFAACRLSLAIPKDLEYSGVADFSGKKIATSYPGILQRWCDENAVRAEIETIGGSVEIAPGIGLADGIFDIVSTGSTLHMNGLKEVAIVAESEAVLIANRSLGEQKTAILERLLFRIEAVRNAAANKYILLNAPDAAVDAIAALLPGIKSPTVLPLKQSGWSSMHSVVKEDAFWDTIDSLKQLGAEGILVMNVEKMIL